MIDQDVRLTQVYVAPTGSTVPNNAPNSADNPLPSFDLIITGEEGDDVQQNGSPYTLRYDACDLTTCGPAPASFSAIITNQNFGGPQWVAIGTFPQEDFVTVQKFTITIPAGLVGHIFQYTASLIAHGGDIVSFVQSEPFILV